MIVEEFPPHAVESLAAAVRDNWQRLGELLAEELAARGLTALGAQLLPETGRIPEILRLYLAIVEGSEARGLPDAAAWAALAAGLRGEKVAELVQSLAVATRRLLDELGVDDPMARRAAARLAETMGWQIREAESHLLGEEARAALELLSDAQSPSVHPLLLASLPDMGIVWCNSAVQALADRTARALRSLNLADLLPDYVSAHKDELPALVDGQQAIEDDASVVRPDGTKKPVRVAALKITLQGNPYLLVVIEDVERWAALTSRIAGAALELQQHVQHQIEELRARHNFVLELIDAIPLRILVLDSTLRIVLANRAYYLQRGVAPEELIGRRLEDVFPRELMEDAGLGEVLRRAIETREPVTWRGYRARTPDHTERVVNMRVDPCTGPGGEPYVILSIEDITAQERRMYEKSLLQQIMQAMLVAEDLPRLLHAILTAVTAGGLCGLGFNRAFLLLTDKEESVLRGAMAVGPETREEAYCIWAEVGEQYQTIEDFMRDYDRLPPPDQRPLARVVQQMVFDLSDTDHLPVLALASGETIHVTEAHSDERVPQKLRDLLDVEEFVVAPLKARDKDIGVAIADNFVTLEPIPDDSVALLSTLAHLAALAIEAARARERERRHAEELRRAYEELERGQQQLIRSKQLAAIGEMSAIVAHEIRNALVPIGGFARRLTRRQLDPEKTKQYAETIYKEVLRLQRILNNLLEAARPREPELRPTDIAPILYEVAELMKQRPDAAKISVKVEVQPDLPCVLIDREQMKQVLLNLAQNAIEAMQQQDGGELTLAARRQGSQVLVEVADTGPGIPPERLERIWDAFLTSKPSGTGIGLGLSRALVARHGATLDVCSQVGEGTKFTITFPPRACTGYPAPADAESAN